MAKIGLLPLYVALYDKSNPELRPVVDSFKNELKDLLEKQGNQIVSSDICCIKPQFEKAVSLFEAEQVDCIISVHLAYSPSLESYESLIKTPLPLLVLDTTPNYLFDCTIDSGHLMENHGIHGVQDLCCMLKRNGKAYSVFAGHYLSSDVIKRVSDAAKAIAAAKALKRGIKVGIIGKKFEGMGDFLVTDECLASLGIEKLICEKEELLPLIEKVSEEEIRAEYEMDQTRCAMDGISYDFYKLTEKIGLGVRKWVQSKKLDGFTMNFQSAGEMPGFETMPFSEASKAMAKSVGYAGEGDVLTAGLCAAFVKEFAETGFVEMFCPDWRNGSIFMSHMGEFNLSLMENPHMIEKDFPFADGFNPTCIMGHAKGGKACLVNISPNGEESFDLIFAEGEMLSLPKSIGSFDNAISGWFKPNSDLSSFLANFSDLGGTHHSIVIYGTSATSLKEFAKQMKLKYTVI